MKPSKVMRAGMLLTLSLFLMLTLVPTMAQSGGDTTKPRDGASQKPSAAGNSDNTPPMTPSSAETPLQAEARTVFDRMTMEREFKEALTGATLQGVWQVTTEGGLTGTAPLSEPKPESYEITSAAKMTDDRWVILARIRFGENDVTVPVPLRVVWAEDTAVITLNELSLPLLGTYSARVMIHHGFYSGVWYCGQKNYGGVLSGRIIKTTDIGQQTDSAKQEDTPKTPVPVAPQK